MRSVISLMLLLASFMQAQAKELSANHTNYHVMDKLVEKLVDKTVNKLVDNMFLPLTSAAEVDSTTLSKTGHFSIPTSHLPAFSASRHPHSTTSHLRPPFEVGRQFQSIPNVVVNGAVSALRGPLFNEACERGSGRASATGGAALPGDEGASLGEALRKGALFRLRRMVNRLKSIAGNQTLNKQRIAALGTSVLLSYGWISNCNACCMCMLSWVTFGKSCGLSPLAPGQWKGFLAVYAGFYVTLGTATRPFRVAAAIAISPLFDKIVAFFQKYFRVSKPVAFGITVFIVNVLVTCSLFVLGLRAVTWIFGVPLLPP